MDFCLYLLFRAGFALVALLPLNAVFLLGKFLGAICHFILWPYRRLVISNLTIAFGGEKSDAEIRRLALDHFQNLGANLLSSAKLATMSREAVQRRIRCENMEILTGAIEEFKGVIGVINHLGNWELFAQMPHFTPGYRFSTIYQKLGNRFLEAEVRKARSRHGVVPFERKEGFAGPLKFLREGGGLAILVDQHAGDAGVWTPLFNRLASTSPLAATLAVRANVPLVPVAIYTEGFARWRMVVSPPIPRETDDVQALTADINQALERQIRESPKDWFWVHDRWKTPYPKFLLATYKRGIAFPKSAISNPQSLKPFRILIRSSNWLGDAVMTVPAVRAIKRGRPDARVTVLTRSKLADFWKMVAGVDEVISIEPNDGLLRVARRISSGFDVAILLPNSVRSALEAFLAGIPRRVGYRARWRAALLNQIFPERKKGTETPPPRHQVHHYLQLAKFAGADVDSAMGNAECGMRKDFRVPTSEFPLRLGLCPGADYGPAKRWMPERFAETARIVSERQACEWVLFGTEKDAELGEQIAKQLDGKCTNLIGKTTLAELIEALSQCRLLLTNDTGTMHLAAFLGVPTISIFGSTEPVLTGPLGPGHRVIRHHVECSPCFLRECPLDFRCMNAVTVDEVVEAVVAKLSG